MFASQLYKRKSAIRKEHGNYYYDTGISKAI